MHKEYPYCPHHLSVVSYLVLIFKITFEQLILLTTDLFLFQCNYLLEEHEEILETWWFDEYGKQKDTDLHQYFCIDNAKGDFKKSSN